APTASRLRSRPGTHGARPVERRPSVLHWLAARGESLAAFDGRCIPAGCVAPRSNTPGILGRRALLAGRLARLGATPDFHHGLVGRILDRFERLAAGDQLAQHPEITRDRARTIVEVGRHRAPA